MVYCKNCGVELDENMNFCPLCGESVDEKPTHKQLIKSVKKNTNEKLYSDYEGLTQIQRRKLFWELSGIILISGIMVTFIIDLVTTKRITWSKYTITACLVIFANATLITFWRHRLLILLGGSFLFSSLLLVLLDTYNSKIGWGIRLGVPILLSFYFITLILTLLVRLTKIKGLNILAYFFMAVGFFSICIEGILSKYFLNEIRFAWSLIVVVSMIPIASILFFIHYRLNRGIELKRFFHI